jgi:polysaccharide biosynthesis transport protein
MEISEVETKPAATPRSTMGRHAHGSSHALPASLTPKELLGILRRHAWFIVFITLAGFCVGGGAWYGLRKYKPSYTAQTFIEVMPPVEADPTQIQMPQVHKDLQYGYRVSMASLIKQQNTYQDLLKLDAIRRTAWFQHFNGDQTRAIKYLKKYLGAYAHRDAEFVTISMTCANADEAAAIVNIVAEQFVKSQGGQKRSEVSDKLVEYEKRRKEIKGEVDRMNKNLDDVRERWGITDVAEQGSTYLHQHPIVANFNKLQLAENDLSLQVSQMQADIKNISDLATGPINEQIEHAIEREPVILALAQQVALHEANLSSQLAKFGPEHRLVRQMQERVNELKLKHMQRKTEIAEQTRQANLKNAQNMLVTYQARLEALQGLHEEAAKKKQDLDLARVESGRLLVMRNERQIVLNTVLEQIEKWRIKLNDPETPKVQLKGPALAPLEMTASRHPLLWFPAGTLLGFLLGMALTFVMEICNDRLRTPSDVARYLDIPLLGIVPDEREDNLPSDVDLCQVVRQAPFSILSESYRRCRANLELTSAKTVLITSGDPDDGKTSTAVNLALTFAAKGRKVIVVDGNFRQPGIQDVFPRTSGDATAKAFGLSSLLLGQCNLRQAVRPTGVDGFDVIDTGLLPPNPAELLAGQRMQALVGELSQVYDHIILDSAPVLLVSDPKVLARVADAVLLVLDAARTRRGAAQRSIRELQTVEAKLAGCVLFAARSIKGGYFHQQHKTYRRYMKPTIAQA